MEKISVLRGFEFMKGIFDKVDSPGLEKEELCGVFFFKGKAYSTNNHIIGRVSDNKGYPVQELLFWSYYKNDSRVKGAWPELKLKALRNFRKNYVENLDRLFDSYSENYFFVKREDILGILSIFKTDSKKSKAFAHVKVHGMFLKFSFIDKYGKSLGNAEIPISANHGKTTRLVAGCSFSVNVLYLFKVTYHSFLNCDIMGFKLKGDGFSHPIIIFNKHKGLDRPMIHWSIAQTLLKAK